MMEIDITQVAKRVVRDVLQLKESDCLHVEAWEHTLPLTKEIIKEARRSGADTLLTLDSDETWYDALNNLPEDWLGEASTLQQAVRRAATASVYIGGPTDPEGMKDIPRDRWRANSRGAVATYKPFEDEPIPSVDIGLARVTEKRARTYGFDHGEWYSSVLSSLSVDPGVIRERGDALALSLKGAVQGHLIAQGGTDFEFEFHGGDPAVFTGEVRPIKGKKSSYFASLPSGSISMALKKGSGDGKVVSTSPIPQLGDFIHGLTWEFSGGRITAVDAQEHLDSFETLWTEEKRKEGADQLGYLTIGLNPEARYGFLENEIVEGAVILGIGNNDWIGGENDCDYGFDIAFRDATLKVDGETLIDGGQLRLG
ncbi:MAG: aminopeptidase [Thermoplasmata archaeon]